MFLYDLFSTLVFLGVVFGNGLVLSFISHDLFSAVVLLGFVLWNCPVFHFIVFIFYYGLTGVCTLEWSSVSFY